MTGKKATLILAVSLTLTIFLGLANKPVVYAANIIPVELLCTGTLGDVPAYEGDTISFSSAVATEVTLDPGGPLAVPGSYMVPSGLTTIGFTDNCGDLGGTITISTPPPVDPPPATTTTPPPASPTSASPTTPSAPGGSITKPPATPPPTTTPPATLGASISQSNQPNFFSNASSAATSEPAKKASFGTAKKAGIGGGAAVIIGAMGFGAYSLSGRRKNLNPVAASLPVIPLAPEPPANNYYQGSDYNYQRPPNKDLGGPFAIGG